MNIFGIGEVELLIVILIALVVAGPKRMIQWAYVAGRWVAKARQMWSEVAALIQQELKDAGVDVEVPKNLPTRAELIRTVETAVKPLAEPVKEAMNEVKSVENEFKSTAKQTQQKIDGIRSDLKQTAGIATAPVPTTMNGTAGKAEKAGDAPDADHNSADNNPTTDSDSNGTVGRFGTWSGNGKQE